MKNLRWCIPLLVFCTAAFAAPPTLELPPTVKVAEYSFGEVIPTGDYEHITWKLPSALQIIKCEKSIKVVGPPGVYTLYAAASNKEGLTEIKSVEVTISGKVTPTPTPVDPVKPEPVNNERYDKVYIAVIEEQMNRTPAIRLQLDAMTEWRKNSKVAQATLYDKNQGDNVARIKGYITQIEKKLGTQTWEKPAVLVMSPTGKVLHVALLESFTLDWVLATWTK